MASAREKAGMALGEEMQKGKVGVRTDKQPSRTETSHIQGGSTGGATRSYRAAHSH